jgi:hypothetical protein
MDTVWVGAALGMLLQVSVSLACIKYSLADLVGVPVSTVKEEA